MTTISQNETAANANEVERSEPAPVCTCQQAETEPTHHGRGGDGDHGKQTVAHAETQANIDAKTDFKAVCLAAASKVTIHDPAKIQKIRGSNVASGNHIELVSDVRGKMIIVGTGVDATIDLIQNTRGALILCNVKVLKATDVRGHVVLVDSKIVDQSNIRGNLRTK